jgi:hypothetical protein
LQRNKSRGDERLDGCEWVRSEEMEKERNNKKTASQKVESVKREIGRKREVPERKE